MAEYFFRMSALRWICILMVYVCGVYSREYVPVFMWESSSELHPRREVPALARISAHEFKDIVMQKLKKKPVVVVFAEESLSAEDFSWQDEAGKGAFPNLENIISESDGLTYLPFVHAPLRAFHHHLPMEGRSWHNVKLAPSGLLSDAAMNETLLFLKLDDATSNEDRPGLLKRHDALISQVYRKLAEQHGDVLAIYTAHHSSWQSGEETLTRRVRHLLQTDSGREEESEKVYFNNRTLLYAPTMNVVIGGISYILENGTVEDVEEVEEDEEGDDGEDGEDLTLHFERVISVKFSFERKNHPGYWSLHIVNVTTSNGTQSFGVTKIGAPLQFSYHCDQEVVFVNGSDTFNITGGFQVQPFLEEKRFGSAHDCVYFFTAPIWSGIFVCTILSIIMAIGLVMIIDIKTMDQFDDPKGKTITINTSE